MSGTSSTDANNDGSATKKLKTSTEDRFPYDARITVLQSFGSAVASVHAGEYAKISANTSSNRRVHPSYSGGASIQIQNFQVGEPLVKFLAHWIYHRDAKEAINASIDRQKGVQPGQLDEEWLVFLLKAMNLSNNRIIFISDITDSLVDTFLSFVASTSGLAHLDQIFAICKHLCKSNILIRIFANLFLHHKKQFIKQIPECAFERAVLTNMQDVLGDILVNDGDFKKLPHDLSVPGYHPCDYHAHGDNKECYVWGRVMNPGW